MKQLVTLCLMLGVVIVCPSARAAHGNPITKGINSLDVFADGSTLHLLIGDYASANESPALLYQRSDDAGATWSKPVRVDKGLTPPNTPHRGSDAQIAAVGKSIVVVWMTAGTGLFGSGPLASATSSDGGKTWKRGPNPADDKLTTGHGFSDITVDAKGAFHLVWLDSRDGQQGLRHARSTNGGRKWSRNVTVKPATCECCWNTLAADARGNVFALFRDKAPRDMALALLPQKSLAWSSAAPAGVFDWQFTGCPHVGGGLAAVTTGSQTRLHSLVWTAREGKTGVYAISSGDLGRTWSEPKRLGDRDARRGDIAARVSGEIAAVWEVAGEGEVQVMGSKSFDGGQTWGTPRLLSSERVNAAYPRVVAVKEGFRVLWTQTEGGVTAWKSVSF